MAHLKKDTTVGGINVYDQLTKQDRETKTLTHGLNVIESDRYSPIKVEFYGNTLVNLLGKDGNFENEKFLSSIIDNENSVYGNKSLCIGYSWDAKFNLNEYGLINGRFYIVLVEAKTNSTIEPPRLSLNPAMEGKINANGKAKNTWHTIYAKFTYDEYNENQSLYLLLGYNEDGINKAWFDGLRIYEIDEETYNKIGVSLTDEDVERMFPYVDGVQHVRNPYVKVEGENLVPTDVDGWEVGGLQWANGEFYDESKSLRTINYISVKPNTQLTVNMYGDYRCAVFEYDNDKKFVRTWSGYNLFQRRTEIVSEKTKFIKLVVRRNDETEGITKDEIMKAQPMLVLGSQSKPFTPYNPSYLYAETVLAGNNDKKDILYYNESKNRWEKIKWWETDVVLDGRWNWEHLNITTVGNNVKVVRFEYPFTNILSNTPDSKEHRGNVTNYKGEILKVRYMADGLDEEAFNVHPDKYIYFAIPNENSGWTYEITPTSNMIKAYFNGWKYTGDGTNHSWCAIGDESITETDINVTSTTLSPTMQDGTIQPYKLTYQLAEPEIEVVQVEGDLAINGTTQVEVGSGFTYTEDEGGQREYTILPENERYDFTCNLEEVKVTYSKNIRSALDDTIAKLTNNVTDTTVLKRQMLDVIARLEAMEGTE